ncbi:hypothetical protein L218DRAFT_768779 [Marasmius fiardii PR-910]|nr:hypothetical protein L218DRAFT_768779 [Marasmius fiardii PR-910]
MKNDNEDRKDPKPDDLNEQTTEHDFLRHIHVAVSFGRDPESRPLGRDECVEKDEKRSVKRRTRYLNQQTENINRNKDLGEPVDSHEGMFLSV